MDALGYFLPEDLQRISSENATLLRVHRAAQKAFLELTLVTLPCLPGPL